MLLGPLEDEQIEAGSFDLMALMDVLQHLAAPARTMWDCVHLLKPDGILLMQTPQFPETSSYDQMRAESDPFLQHLQPEEHLYLFSPRSIRELLHQLRAHHVTFEPAIFAHYDMFLVASQAPLAVHSPEEVSAALSATVGGRPMQAMLDLDDQRRELHNRSSESEAVRAAQLDQIGQLTQSLEQWEVDRATQLEVIHEQER